MTARVLKFRQRKTEAPRNEMLKVGGRKSDEQRGRRRSHLTLDEIERVLDAASSAGRHGHRDRTLLLVMFRHGLRVSEATDLRWTDVDFKGARLNVRRLKGSRSGTHPIEGDELRALKKMNRNVSRGAFVFETERDGPMVRSAVNKIVTRAGQLAGIEFPITPHMLRHSCGYVLANKGVPTRTLQEYLGHASIQNTVRYTALSDAAFRGLWR
jgi:type 1 fimbriae regulatory protein FimB